MIIPPKLKKSDTVCVIAPSRSLGLISEDIKKAAIERLEKLGLQVVFGKHVDELDEFSSSSIDSRIEDLHEAFSNKKVNGILTVIGGFNINQLLPFINWGLIKNNPKVFCGFSDITVLSNAIFVETGLVTYYGPHFSSFGQKKYLDYTVEYFKKCCMDEGEYEIKPSEEWSDDKWYLDQENRRLSPNEGWWAINNGKGEGRLVGGNLNSLSLLQGTNFFPSLDGTILLIEDDEDVNIARFDRRLESLIMQKGFDKVRGIIIGRFQKVSGVKRTPLEKSIKSKRELGGIPILANVDFGHTDPKITFPIGGKVKIAVSSETSSIKILNH